MRDTRVVMPLIFLAAAVVWMAPMAADPSGFPFLRGAEQSDLLLAHAPSAILLRQSVSQWGEIPLWNPYLLGGIPFAADPLSGLWYPPFWLAALVPAGLAFSIIFWAHLALAGWGMAKLLEAMGVSFPGAVVGGLVFSGAPKLAAHIGLGHLGLVCAVSWTPWVLLSIRQATESVAWSGSLSAAQSARPGLFLAISFAADPRWTPPLVLAALLVVLDSVRQLVDGVRRHGRRALVAPAKAALVAGSWAVGLTAVAWVPLEEYLRLSTRSALGSSGTVALSLPPGNLLQILVPGAPVSGEWLTYMGVATLFLAVAGILGGGRGRLLGVVLVAGGLAWSLGSATPLAGSVSAVWPGMSLLRVPARMLIFAVLGGALLAGPGFDALTVAAQTDSRKKLIRMAAAGLTASILAIHAFLLVAGVPLNIAGTWSASLLAPAALGATLFALRRKHLPLVSLAWVAITLVDLGVYRATLLEVRSAESVRTAQRAAEWLGGQTSVEPSRLLTPTFGIPQFMAPERGIRLAGGVHPLPLANYWQSMAAAVGFDPSPYSVTLPPLPGGDPSRRQNLPLSADGLGRLNVGWLVSGYPVASPGWDLRRVEDGLLIYRNRLVFPRAWVQAGAAWGEARLHPAPVMEASANRIRLRARGPGVLVLAETLYPGWVVRVDGSGREVIPIGGLLRGVELGEGEHDVVFQFLPPRVFLGAALTLVSVALGFWLRGRP